jgi:hypothetical protein
MYFQGLAVGVGYVPRVEVERLMMWIADEGVAALQAAAGDAFRPRAMPWAVEFHPVGVV